ncbi:PiggyBac transposable element-derived protein 2 [Trichinella nativa]|uniref:PiggyBac transposable element-derived protein 2 n=1 Tax=Trichinella nativa TaxID=6335 RepID=A0A0V1KVA6_9BILA|nr:PiggyBac transposable element-derived protein 2 [Trichinella nativa]
MVARSLVLCGFAWSEQPRCHIHFILTLFQQLTTGVVAVIDDKSKLKMLQVDRQLNRSDLFLKISTDEHFFWFGKGKSKADYALIADRLRMARMKRCTSGRNCHGRLEPELIVLPDADDSELDIDSDESVELLADGEEENFSSDEETPIEASERRRKRTFNFKWKSQRFVNRDVPWTEEDSMDESASDEQEKSPVDYFRYFITKDAIRLITERTNIHAAQKKSKFRTTETEVETFLGVLLKMGVVALPQFKMYWSADFRVDSIANSMSRNRFIELLRFLHFNDNEQAVLDRHHPSYDTFYKVRPLLDLFLQSCRGLKNEEKHSIGQSVIPFKGRCGIRQPLPCKPNKWEIKIYVRCGASGLLYDFLFCDDNEVEVEMSSGFVSGDVVLKLCETLPKHANHKVYFDSHFNFLEVQVMLKEMGIWSTGTLRSNRLRGAKLEDDSYLKRRGRGSYAAVTDPRHGVGIVKWLDNRPVILSSTFVGTDPVVEKQMYDMKRKTFIQVPVPQIVNDYRQSMGGVHISNMLNGLYKLDHKSKKWHRRILYWLLSSAVANAWLIYRKDVEEFSGSSEKPLNLLDFTISVASSLCHAEEAAELVRRGPKSRLSTSPTADGTTRGTPILTRSLAADLRYDEVSHWPLFSEKRMRCKLCSKIVQISCSKCQSYWLIKY